MLTHMVAPREQTKCVKPLGAKAQLLLLHAAVQSKSHVVGGGHQKT